MNDLNNNFMQLPPNFTIIFPQKNFNLKFEKLLCNPNYTIMIYHNLSTMKILMVIWNCYDFSSLIFSYIYDDCKL